MAATATDATVIDTSLATVDVALLEFQHYNRLAMFGGMTNETEDLTDGLLHGAALHGDSKLVRALCMREYCRSIPICARSLSLALSLSFSVSVRSPS
jgi:hypothetical protein